MLFRHREVSKCWADPSTSFTIAVRSGETEVGMGMARLDLHYVDPRLVDLYDIENPRGIDTDFYLSLARDLNARTVLDLGCGTGLLTRELATDRRKVVGIDPASAMLAVARQQPGAERVEWVEGDSRSLGTPGADLVVMTGNVAQVFLDDSDWAETLGDIHAALRPGGYLAFESRNPEAREWEQWNRDASYNRYDSVHGPVECWVELTVVHDGRVSFNSHKVFEATGEVVVTVSELGFRSKLELTNSLVRSGFAVQQVYGDWDCRPVTITSRVMVFVARRI